MVDIENCFRKIDDIQATLLFFYLLHKADDDGYVSTTYTSMGKDLNRSRSTLHKYVKKLADIGVIEYGLRTRCEQDANKKRTKNELIYIPQTSDYKQVVSMGANKVRTKREQSANKVRTKNIEERKRDFIERLKPYVEIYGKDMLNDFYRYWAQVNDNGTKMLWEKQKCFEINLRLATWKKNETERGKQQTRAEDIGVVLAPTKDKFKNEEVW